MTSNEGEEREWFRLEVQLYTKSFWINVYPSNFCNSPSRTKEFREYLAFLINETNRHDESPDEMDGDDGGEGDGNEDETQQRTNSCHIRELDVTDCFAWAVEPCLALFSTLSPPPPTPDKLTLSHFLADESFECNLLAVDETLVPGTIEPTDIEDDGWVPDGLEEDDIPHSTPITTFFPSFTPAEVEVICPDPQHPFESNPAHVRVRGRDLFFKPSHDPDDILARNEIAKYEKMVTANLGPDVRTSRLYGVVRNKKDQVVGLLLHRIDEDTTLTFAVEPDTPEVSKARWTRQIMDTLAALHSAGIVWGDAKPDNILVDVHGDAWVIDFGGGRTEGWVDSDKAGTVEGDLQGLERILRFIEDGEGA